MLSRAAKEAGYKAVPQPSERTTAILRRIAAGHILVTHAENGNAYSYADGSPMSAPLFNRLRNQNLILPIDKENLLGDPLLAQRWRARTPADGPLPKWIAPRR